ncbi:MAG: HD domain-containing protein [Candidatus Diapherotrites archaeon]|nr:HD domain-containing protein [Candidatus Diapherotrites archaeon]
MRKKVSKVAKAGFSAIQIHRNQIRKPSGGKYDTHPVAVAKMLRDYGSRHVPLLRRSIKGRHLLRNKSLIFQAALLHDTIESKPASFRQLSKKFGKQTMAVVMELSNDKTVMNRVGSAIYLTNKMNNMSSEALLIKLADRLCYVLEMNAVKHVNPNWLKPAVQETRAIVKGIKKRISKETSLHKELYSRIESGVANL